MEPETFTWTDAEQAKLVPNMGVVVLFRGSDGQPQPQLRIVAMTWRRTVFLIDARDGRRFQAVRLEQCDPGSLVPAAEMQAIARGGSAA